MANIRISALLQQHIVVSQEKSVNVNGGAIALPSFLNQANKARPTEKLETFQSNKLLLNIL